jgi:hypothetical protein
MMKIENEYNYNLLGEIYKVRVKIGKYPKGNNSIELYDLEDGFPFAKSTVNLPGLERDEVAIKNYSENEGMLDFLVDNGIVHSPHRSERSGFVTVPVCKIKEDR